MILQLNPRIPLVWRTPDTIQIGVDRPLGVFPGMTTALERVVVALRAGVPRSGALLLGQDSGASEAEINALLRTLRPALLDAAGIAPSWAEPAVVCVDGCGPTTDRIRSMVGDLGVTIAPDAPAGPPAALAVIVGYYVLEPERHGRWLRRDIPHLPVVFSDTEIRVGPLVEPGTGPCLYCLELAHIDADPAWPALAVQLLRRDAPTETPRRSIEVAARVAGIVQDRLRAGTSPLAGASLAIDAQTGVVRRRAHRPHERCACQAPPGNVTALAESAVASPRRPSSAATVGAPG